MRTSYGNGGEGVRDGSERARTSLIRIWAAASACKEAATVWHGMDMALARPGMALAWHGRAELGRAELGMAWHGSRVTLLSEHEDKRR